MKIILGCDHGAFDAKEAIKSHLLDKGEDVLDVGCHDKTSVNYPDYADLVGRAITEGSAERGILLCTTGIGMCFTVNRFPAVRGALVSDVATAKQTRDHNNSNVLCLSGAEPDTRKLLDIVDTWLSTPFSGAARHAARNAASSQVGNRLIEVDHLRESDPEIYASIQAQVDQENTTINLIASENTVTRTIREAQGSVLTNKYAEGYPGKRWYGGCHPVDDIESIAIRRACELFGAEAANVQPHCGSSANLAVYLGVLKAGDKILSMSLDQGGHLSHGSPANISGQNYHIVPYTVDPETELLNYDAIEELALREKPQLILAGASAYPRTIDFARFRDIADKVGAYLLVDMAHIAGLVAGGAHPSPVPYADFVTTTTHKTLRGPRGGLILCKEKYLKQINHAVFPGLQGGPLEHAIAAKAVCFREAMMPEFKDYAHQVVKNTARLCEVVKSRGFRIVSGGTDNHLFLVDVAASGLTGKVCSAALEAAGIIANKNTIPYDKNSPFVTSGIRIGAASATTRGMKEAEMERIGGWIADIFEHVDDTALQARIREEVAAFAVQYPVP